MERLNLKGLRERISRGASFTGHPGRYVKKALGTGISTGAPLQLRRTWNLEVHILGTLKDV
jgi:hypothetical protein